MLKLELKIQENDDKRPGKYKAGKKNEMSPKKYTKLNKIKQNWSGNYNYSFQEKT